MEQGLLTLHDTLDQGNAAFIYRGFTSSGYMMKLDHVDCA